MTPIVPSRHSSPHDDPAWSDLDNGFPTPEAEDAWHDARQRTENACRAVYDAIEAIEIFEEEDPNQLYGCDVLQWRRDLHAALSDVFPKQK